MAAQREPFVSPEQYLEWDRQAEFKSEYMGGEIIALAGASYRHSTIVTNLGASLRDALRGGSCRVHMNDLRVQIERTGAPDGAGQDDGEGDTARCACYL